MSLVIVPIYMQQKCLINKKVKGHVGISKLKNYRNMVLYQQNLTNHFHIDLMLFSLWNLSINFFETQMSILYIYIYKFIYI